MKTLLVFIATIVSLHSNSQTYWNAKNYDTITVGNFRNYQAFKYAIDTSKIDYALLNACLFYVVNEQRVKKNLPITPRHIGLETTAFFHSKKMAELFFYSHDNIKDSTRKSTDQRGKLAGIKNPLIAECIYERHFENGLTYLALCEDFTKGWMESKGHHDIIMSAENRSFGAGIYFKPNQYFDFRGTLNFQWFKPIVYEPKSAVDILPY